MGGQVGGINRLSQSVTEIVDAVKATGLVLAGRPWEDMSTWLQIMIAFDIIYLVVATLVFEFVVEE